VLMNGFVIDSADDILSLFKNQQPQQIEVESMVSNRVASFVHFGMSDPLKWFEDQTLFTQKFGVTSIDSLGQELSRLSVDIESIRKTIGNQFANCYIGNGNNTVTIVKLNVDQNQVSVFEELASKISLKKKDSIYIENYAGYDIGLIDYSNFLYQLFYPLAPQSDQSFFVRVGNYILISESVAMIKASVDDMDAENTWGKSVDWNKFLANTLRESNVNLFFDGKLTSIRLRDRFNSKWRPFFDSTYFLGIDKGSAQLSRLESNFYLNASLQFSEPQVKANSRNLQKITYNFASEVIKPPKIVRSHLTKDIELIVQDSLNSLYLFSKDLKLQWNEPIAERIRDDIEQLDFFANGKLQYFFTSQNQIHLIDRLGRYVDGFPKTIGSGGFEYSSVVDYDRSKRYRYLMTDVKGNLSLTDKNCNLLEGWNPRTLSGKMLVAAKHNRILGKDYFFALQQDGTMNLINRRGEMVRGFPIDLGYRPSGNFFITVGNSLNNSFLTVVSKDGSKVEFGLNGQIKSKEALLKKTGFSQFELVKSSSEDSFVFLRTDPGKLGVLDHDGNVIFEIENPGSTNWKLTYVENRLKERFYCLYDMQQHFSYAYDSHGALILPQPFESSQLPTLYFDEKQKSLSIYNVFESSLSLISIQR